MACQGVPSKNFFVFFGARELKMVLGKIIEGPMRRFLFFFYYFVGTLLGLCSFGFVLFFSSS